MQAGFVGHIGESPVAVVFVEAVRRTVGRASKTRAAKNEQVHPSVIVVVKESAAAAGGLDDVLFDFLVAINHRRVQARGSGNVHEMRVERTAGSWGPWQWFCRMTRNTLRQQAKRTQRERGSHPELEKPAAVEIHYSLAQRHLCGKGLC